MSSRIRINRGAESDGGVPGINKEHRSNHVMFVDIDPHKVFEIIADNLGFVSPFSEPYGYYMYFSAHDSEKDIDKSACETLYLSKLRGGEHGGAGGYADKHSIFSGKNSSCFKRVLVCNSDYLVINSCVERIGHKSRAYPLNFVRTCRAL